MYSDLIFDYIKKNIESDHELDFNTKQYKNNIVLESYNISTIEQEKEFGKPKGQYKLITIPDVLFLDENKIKYITSICSEVLSGFIGSITSRDKILVVGLGNRHISSDSLGAKVCGKVSIVFDCKHIAQVMAIAPSVMGLTGIETVDIVESVINKVKPTHVIIIDSLCASSYERLGRSIQITNTGICPGGGISNHRKCIDRKIAPNVYSIGVPFLIYASTFIKETLEKNGITEDVVTSVMHSVEKQHENREIIKLLKSLKSVSNENIDKMIVSIKDIEECVEIISSIIANSINNLIGL